MPKLNLAVGVPQAPSPDDLVPEDCQEHALLGSEERRFVSLYLQEPNLHRVAARLGVTHKQVCEIRRRPKVLVAIRKWRKKLEAKCLIQPRHLLKELERIAFSDVTEYEVDAATGKVKVSGNEPGAVRAISSIKRKVTRKLAKSGNGDIVEHTETEIKLWSKLEAQKLLADLLGWMDRKPGESEPTKVYVNLDMRGILTPQEQPPQPLAIEALPHQAPSAANESPSQESTTTPSEDSATDVPIGPSDKF